MPLAVRQIARTRHREAVDWASRVATAGGTVNLRTLNAVDRFCRDIEAAGIRGKFYRLNLMCGSDLTACLVPLYRNTSFAGSALGNTTDTNNNFVSGDYNETGSSTGGLKGNGSSKQLSTGLNPVSISASVTDIHLSVYVKGTESSGTSRYMLSNTNLGTNGPGIGWLSSGSRERFHTPGVTIDGATSGKDGFLAGSCGSSDSAYYQNGSSLATGGGGSGSFTNASFVVFASGGLLYSLARYFRAYSIGLHMTSTQWSSYNAAMQDFQKALDRAV